MDQIHMPDPVKEDISVLQKENSEMVSQLLEMKQEVRNLKKEIEKMKQESS